MKRIDEKVRDIVDVRVHPSLTNFAADPLQTLTGYHFTDVTAAMMGKWISAVSRTKKGSGASLALAGFRGVGKSHFMAALGSLLAHPEFRLRISDPLVQSEAQGLSRKSYAVAFVRRGTQPTVLAELKDAIAPIIGCEPSSLSDSLNEILMRASDCSGELPLILLIDTAFERGSRVVRDDGPILSEIAVRAKELGIFIGIALDDDIAGADGLNSSISQTFLIDYLDQEHLYKIVDHHIFPKNSRMQSVLHDIYEYYKTAVPGFRWSEERFRSLYPLHPSIMEIAPFVRLFLHDFALLSFASEAGSRILGRPANSLIAPDEVFDNAESSLREVDSLQEAFRAFDKINAEVVAKTPVMKRLQAKLILKGLLLFSLNDEGATASEIGASMLIFDEHDPTGEVKHVEDLMASFAEAMPDQIRAQPDRDGKLRYAFKLDVKDGLRSALRAAAEGVSDDVVSSILKKQVEERFSDCSFTNADQRIDGYASECSLEWRGGLRKGRVLWNIDGEADANGLAADGLDWVAVIESHESAEKRDRSLQKLPVISWCPAALSDDDLITIKSYHLLMSDAAIREEFEDYLAAAVQSHAVAVEKVFQRIFLEDGVLSIDGFEYNFTEDARSAQSQAQVFSIMLESLFEGRFPLHPYFSQIIRMKEVSTLVTDLFGGADSKVDDVQALADLYGAPLGIVTRANGSYVPADKDQLLELPLVVEILNAVKKVGSDVLTLDEVFLKLSAVPHGLVREASYLILAAMVSARMLEFVTSNEDRINHRSLDLRLIWDDIVGVATPGDAGYSNDRLVFWAKLLTGKDELKELETVGDRSLVVTALQEWQDRWNGRRLAARFDEVSDALITSRMWRVARKSIKAFRTVSESIESVLGDERSLEQCLNRIADAFSDSELEFTKLNEEVSTLEDFIVGAKLREEISSWVSRCEFTGSEDLDRLRMDLDAALWSGIDQTSALSNVDLENKWDKFHRAYSEHFLLKHDALIATNGLKEKLDEIFKTDVWWEFENLCDIPGFDDKYSSRTKKMIQEIRNFECRYDTNSALKISPACGCRFSLVDYDSIEGLPHEMWKVVNNGIVGFRSQLGQMRDQVIAEFRQFSKFDANEAELSSIADLTALLSNPKDRRRLTQSEMSLIRKAFIKIERRRVLSIDQMEPEPGIPDFSELEQQLDALIGSAPG